MRNIWFSSDQHFGHKNIIKYCNRPFDSIEEHDEALIANWNSRISAKDTVYFLGDLAMNSHYGMGTIMPQLNGHISFILGNHDSTSKISRYMNQIAELRDYLEINNQGLKIVLFHYPIWSWNGIRHGSWHLFGHVHGNMPNCQGKMMDIGVDSIAQFGEGSPNDYVPIHIDEVAGILDDKG